MTEEKAKTKWCPMVRAANTFDAGGSFAYTFNRDDLNTNCIASDCMMWRARTRRDMGYDRNPYDIHDYYCGLAGLHGAL